MRVEVYRDSGSGTPTGQPFFAIVAQNIYNNRHVAVQPVSLSVGQSTGRLWRLYYRSPSLGYGFDPYSNAFYEFSSTIDPGTLDYQIRKRGGGNSNITTTNRTNNARFWSDYVCNGNWVVVVIEQFRYSSSPIGQGATNTRTLVTRRTASFTVTNRVCPDAPATAPSVTATATSDTTINVSWVRTGTISPTYWEISTDGSHLDAC